jgi:monomeric sarcosine oxidase
MNQTYDVAIIGAGVFGAWTAYQLQRSAHQVILIDAYGPGNSRSSSGDESRVMRMGYGADEIYTRSAQRSLEKWKEFAESCGEQVFHQTGALWLAHEDDPYAVRTKETLTRVGVPLETLTSNEIARRYPQLGQERIAWAMLESEAGVLLARRSVQAVVRAAVDAGATFLRAAVPTPLGVQGKKTSNPDAWSVALNAVFTSEGQRISAGAHVFACGPWLPKLFPDLLGDRIHPTRQEVFYFGVPPGDGRFQAPALPTWIDFKEEIYGLPDIEGRGLKVAIDRHGEPFDPDTGDRVVTSNLLAEARRYLARRLPAMKDAPVIESRVCQYENTSNGDFLIDRHPEFENVWLVGGGSGHGFKHGPVVGEYVAARVNGDDAVVEPRFSLGTKRALQSRTVY